jgi:3-deoxy-D-manno-octulosonic-acid transferase
VAPLALEWEDLAGGVLVLDTIGELASVYSLGDLAFVGGSLVEFGGHNILEPVQYGVATLIGPHYENFRDMVNSFHAAEAVRIVGPAELPLMLLELLSNPGERRAIGERGLERLRSEAGATKRTLSMLQQLLADRVSHAAL